MEHWNAGEQRGHPIASGPRALNGPGGSPPNEPTHAHRTGAFDALVSEQTATWRSGGRAKLQRPRDGRMPPPLTGEVRWPPPREAERSEPVTRLSAEVSLRGPRPTRWPKWGGRPDPFGPRVPGEHRRALAQSSVRSSSALGHRAPLVHLVRSEVDSDAELPSCDNNIPFYGNCQERFLQDFACPLKTLSALASRSAGSGRASAWAAASTRPPSARSSPPRRNGAARSPR